jgi:elongation factor 1-beta
MGMVILIVKLMPESPSANLENIKETAQKLMEHEGAKSISFEEKPIAFGLKAIMLKMVMPEEKGTDIVESKLSTVNEVSSVTIEDYRRAFG